jgi:hypothetical protein
MVDSLDLEVMRLYRVKYDLIRRHYESVVNDNPYARRIIMLNYEEADKMIEHYKKKLCSVVNK